MITPRFELHFAGRDCPRVLCMAGSEWHLFNLLRRLAAERREIVWLESSGRPLVPRSLAALNCYLRTGAIRRFKSRRFDGGRELLGFGEWRRFCRMLGLKFDGKGTRQAVA